jgi:diaminopimelate decarboxylase
MQQKVVTPKLKYKNNVLYFEEVEVKKLAETFGTPLYVYSKNQIIENFNNYKKALKDRKHLICYAVKANTNYEVIKTIRNLGSGADVTSYGELWRVLTAGVPPKKIVFAGVGKTEEEIKFAIKNKILMFNIESKDEAELINKIAKEKVDVSIRVNPEVNTHTIGHISTGEEGVKFGIPIAEVIDFAKYIRYNCKNLNLVGLHFHIGSQICTTKPFIEAAKKVVKVFVALKELGFKLSYIDVGGGLGIKYKDEQPPTPQELFTKLKKIIPKETTIICEPGRSVVGNAGILLCKVLYHKKVRNKNFIIVNASMTDLIRPTFYGAYHNIVPVELVNNKLLITADIVGPVCETSDFLAKNRTIIDVNNGELLVVETAGAYGFVMSSNYNSRLRPAEVMVDKKKFYLIRQRDTYEDLVRKEIV